MSISSDFLLIKCFLSVNLLLYVYEQVDGVLLLTTLM